MSMGGIWMDRSSSILRGLMERLMWQTIAVVRLASDASAIEVDDLAGFEQISLRANLPVATGGGDRMYLRLNDDNGGTSYRTAVRQDLGSTGISLASELEAGFTSVADSFTSLMWGYLVSPSVAGPRSWWGFSTLAALTSQQRWHLIGRWIRDNTDPPPNEAIDKVTLWPNTGEFAAGGVLVVQGVVRP